MIVEQVGVVPFFFPFLEGDRSMLLLSVVSGFLFSGIIGCVGGPKISTEERTRRECQWMAAVNE